MRNTKRLRERDDSSGNLVNVGNFDADGVNVNDNDPDDTNDWIGTCLSRMACGYFWRLWLFSQPPSIFFASTIR